MPTMPIMPLPTIAQTVAALPGPEIPDAERRARLRELMVLLKKSRRRSRR
jgi:hypothetical protein